MTSTLERILHVQSPSIGPLPILTFPTQFTIDLEPALHIDKHTTLAVYISLLEFSCKNLLITAGSTPTITHPNIFVNCSLSNSTVSFNGKPSNVLDNITVDEASVIKHVNYNPIRLNISSSTIGTVLSHITFWITDDNNDKIELRTPWRAKLLLEIIEE
jgi:hypothetical protein